MRAPFPWPARSPDRPPNLSIARDIPGLYGAASGANVTRRRCITAGSSPVGARFNYALNRFYQSSPGYEVALLTKRLRVISLTPGLAHGRLMAESLMTWMGVVGRHLQRGEASPKGNNRRAQWKPSRPISPS